MTLLSYLPDLGEIWLLVTLVKVILTNIMFSDHDGFWRTVTTDPQDWVHDFETIKY